MGDIYGIGPEIILKALAKIYPKEDVVFHIVGNLKTLKYYIDLLKIELPIVDENKRNNPPQIAFIDVPLDLKEPYVVGKISQTAGKASALFLSEAIKRIKKCENCGLVTAPISKEAFWRANISFPGHTEFLSNAFKVDNQFAMMLVSGEFRVGFVTTHHPLKEIPSILSVDLIIEKCLVVQNDLRKRFNVKNPSIAITALNPHGGENGQLGKEEQEIIIPAIQKLEKNDVLVEGPFPSDTLFVKGNLEAFDAFLALYHDQGMIPIKMYSFGKAVNYTAGLPIVRTSPGHGTAFDIAGKGIADESSMVEAIELAISLVN